MLNHGNHIVYNNIGPYMYTWTHTQTCKLVRSLLHYSRCGNLCGVQWPTMKCAKEGLKIMIDIGDLKIPPEFTHFTAARC